EAALVADGDQPAQDDVEVVALLALEDDRVARSHVGPPHVVRELGEHLTGELLEEPDARELGDGRCSEAWHGAYCCGHGRAGSVEALSALRSRRRAGSGPARVPRLRLPRLRELEADRERGVRLRRRTCA